MDDDISVDMFGRNFIHTTGPVGCVAEDAYSFFCIDFSNSSAALGVKVDFAQASGGV